MKHFSKLSAVLLVAGISLAFTVPAAAQGGSQKKVQLDAQASAEGDLQTQIDQLRETVSQLQERVSELESQVNSDSEAEASKETSEDQRSNNSENLGSQVSEEAKSGDRRGIFSAISGWLSDRGNNQAAESVGGPEDPGRSDESREETANETDENESDADEEPDSEDESESREEEGEVNSSAEAETNLELDQ